MDILFEAATQNIIQAGHRLDALRLAPATSGNYSIRLGEDEMAITVSGAHKGKLTPAQVMRADLMGRALEDKKPSAETLLHCQIYRIYPQIGAILHSHSIACTVLSRLIRADEIRLEGYELLKAYPGVMTHDISISLPIFDNTQDMEELSARTLPALTALPHPPAYLIRGHGLYGWGRDMAEAERVIEATEFLLHCEMETMKMGGGT